MDLSFPLGKGINAGIRRAYYQGRPFSFILPSLTTLTDRLIKSGPGSFNRFRSADLSRAYTIS